MKAIQDIAELGPRDVLYHSAFGFARVVHAEARGAELKWERDAPDLPVRVGAEAIRRAYARCAPDGFFSRALAFPDRLRMMLVEEPTDGLALLLDDLPGPQAPHDLRDWVVGRGLMSAPAFDAWWRRTEAACRQDPRFEMTKGRVALRGRHLAMRVPVAAGLNRAETTPPAPESRAADPVAPPIPDGAAVIAAHLTRPSATTAAQLADLGADAALALLADRSDAMERGRALIAELSWSAEHVSMMTHGALLDRAIRAEPPARASAQAAWLVFLIGWNAPDPASAIAEALASRPGPALQILRESILGPGPTLDLPAADRLMTSLLVLVDGPGTIDLLIGLVAELVRRSPAAGKRLEWYALHLRERGRPDLSVRLEATSSPPPTRRALAPRALPPARDALVTPLEDLDLRAALGTDPLALHRLGRAMAAALVTSSDDGAPTRYGLVDWGLPTFCVQIEASRGAPRNRSTDVHGAAVRLIEALLGRPWVESGTAPERVLPYLRMVAPELPASTLAPLGAALHGEPASRPAASAWVRQWDLSIEAETARVAIEHRQNVRTRAGYDSHIGKVKILQGQTNQDAVWVSTRGSRTLLAVCDGISTATAGSGDLAAGITTHVLATLWDQAVPRMSDAGPDDVRRFVEKALDTANRAVCEATVRLAGGSMEGKVPMGTTAVVACVLGNRVHLAWVGDSRAYVVGPYGASLITADQNQAARRLAEWNARARPHWDPGAYALVGYVGHFDDDMTPRALTPVHVTLTLLAGERLVLCTDGVTDFLGATPPEVDAAMAGIVLASEDLEEAARSLVNLANRGGGGDNASAVVAGLSE